jgi:hypothetical protein
LCQQCEIDARTPSSIGTLDRLPCVPFEVDSRTEF